MSGLKDDEMKKRLLLNYVYYDPVGHVIEALKFARGLAAANNDLEIYITLNKRAPFELTKACPFIKKVYPIDLYEIMLKGEKANCLKNIPKKWDYIVTNNLPEEFKDMKRLYSQEKGMLKYVQLSDKIFYSKHKSNIFPETKLPKSLKYRSTHLRFNVPKKAQTFTKRYNHKGEKICILLGGSSGYRYYPSIRTWIKIIISIEKEFPDCKIYLTGIKKSKRGGTKTRGYTESNINNVLNRFKNAIDCYDIGMWNQIALLEKCDVLIAPHSGFSFLASCVDTPLLEISGGDWSAYLFNHIPFYCVLPDDKDFPYRGKGKYSKHSGNFSARVGKIPPFEPKKLEKKIPEILEGIHLLLNKDFTYEKAMKRYKENIKEANVQRSKLATKEFF
jgi:ADP-heptose:LPS heptosyltransferase